MKTHSFIRTLLIAGSMLLTAINAYTQSSVKSTPVTVGYPTEVGLRLGGTSGLSLKTAITNAQLEAIVGVSPSGFSLTGLYEKRRPVNIKEPGLSWYYGAGGHLSLRGELYYYDYRFDRYYYDRYSPGAMGLGIDGILGLEYKIPDIPFSISVDLKPYMEVATDRLIYFSPDPSIGFRFVF